MSLNVLVLGWLLCSVLKKQTPNCSQARQQTLGENDPIDVLDIDFDPG